MPVASRRAGDLLRVLGTLELTADERSLVAELLTPEPADFEVATGRGWTPIPFAAPAPGSGPARPLLPIPTTPTPVTTGDATSPRPSALAERANRWVALDPRLGLTQAAAFIALLAAALGIARISALPGWIRSALYILAVACAILGIVQPAAAVGRLVAGWWRRRADRVVWRGRVQPPVPVAGVVTVGGPGLPFERTKWVPSPDATSLVPAGQLRTFATAVAAQVVAGEVDERALVERVASLQPLEPLPRYRRWSVRRGVQIHVQAGAGMEPFAADAARLVEELRLAVSTSLVGVLTFDDDPRAAAPPGRSARRRVDHRSGESDPIGVERYLPPRGGTVLVVGDLGIGRARREHSPAGPDAWLAHAAAIRQAGCRVAYLVPYPADRRPAALAELPVMYWGDDSGVGELRATLATGATP